MVGQNGLEPSTSRLSVVCSSQLSYWPISAHFFWWRLAGSNRWPPACKAGALPAELNPRIFIFSSLKVVGQNGLAFLRKSHAGCNSPPDCCQEPAFESILMNSLSLKPFASDHHFLFLKWWAKMDSNHRPHDYQSCALASWAIGPYWTSTFFHIPLSLYPLNWIT